MNAQEIPGLKKLFIDHLKTLYWAEKKLVDVLPDMAEAASSQELKDAFKDHLNETRQHVSRLDQVFDIVGEEREAEKCKILGSIADTGDKTISKTDDDSMVRDAGLIFVAQLAEHYEIASYGNMIAWARTLGFNNVADILSHTLLDEKNADALLTQIGESYINAEV